VLWGAGHMAGGQGFLATAQVLPRSTALQHSDLRLCLTTLVVSLAFLATASLRLGHYCFQVSCLTYLLKSYFLTLLYALAGLTILAVIAFFVSKSDEQVLFRRYKPIWPTSASRQAPWPFIQTRASLHTSTLFGRR